MSGIAVERNSLERITAREVVYQHAPKTCPVMKEVVVSGDSADILVAKKETGDIKIACLYKPKDLRCEGCSLVHNTLIRKLQK